MQLGGCFFKFDGLDLLGLFFVLVVVEEVLVLFNHFDFFGGLFFLFFGEFVVFVLAVFVCEKHTASDPEG